MLPDTMFRNAILQRILNIVCFGTGANRRGHYFTGLDKLSLVTLALLMDAVVNAIDGWKTGRPENVDFAFDPYADIFNDILAYLEKYAGFSATQDEDLLAGIQREMLRKARETSKTPVVEKEQRGRTMFSVNAFALNQPRPVAGTSN
ncbi:hypothetical protein B0H10DRAFT_2243152 [Mycena sp. CBHHK59/15]|nr:hypothetical protein B0H10DRAFT_2243152 [Mycena sp. CBHHK59/15]